MFGNRVATGVDTGRSGALLGNEIVVRVPPLGAVVVPLGDHYCYDIGADIVVQIQNSLGVWKTVSVGSLIASDGMNVRFFNLGAAIESITIQKIG